VLALWYAETILNLSLNKKAQFTKDYIKNDMKMKMFGIVNVESEREGALTSRNNIHPRCGNDFNFKF